MFLFDRDSGRQVHAVAHQHYSPDEISNILADSGPDDSDIHPYCRYCGNGYNEPQTPAMEWECGQLARCADHHNDICACESIGVAQ